jgi:plasmid stabilization system protein ParE
MHRLQISEPAQADIQSNYDWWRTNRSVEQAERWYRGVYDAIRSLRQNPERCVSAPESDIYPAGLREEHFGIGRRSTHRIVFTIEEGVVKIVRVRHASQQSLRPDDLV